MKKRLFCLAVLCAIALLPAAALAQERGYDSQEACVQALFAAMQTRDVAAMDACVAFDEMAARFDFAAQVERFGAIVSNMPLPAEGDPFAVEYNRAYLKRMWYTRLEAFNMSMVDPQLVEALFQGRALTSKSESFGFIMDTLETQDGFNYLSLLTYEGLLTPEDIPSIRDKYYSDRNIENIHKSMAVWRIVNFTEVGVKISSTVDTAYTEGAQYIIPLRLLEFDGRWLIDPNPPALGMLLDMSPTDFVVALP